jgi:hypothetical protein
MLSNLHNKYSMHLIDMFEKLDEKSKQPQDAKSKLLDFEKQVREMAKSQGLQPRTFLQRIAEKNSKIANNRVIQHLIGEQDVPTQKGRDAKPNVLTPRAMNTVKKQIKKDANKHRRIDSKSAIAKALHDDTEDDYGYAKMIINQNPKEYAKMKQTGDLMDAPTIYDKLFQYFAFDPSADEQMPYGTAKARDGDPYVWIADKLADLGLDEGNEFAQKVRQMKAAGAKKGTKFKTSDGEEHTLEQDDDLPAFLKQAKKKEKEDKQKQAELDKKTASARMTTAHTNEVADLNDALKHLQDLLLDPMIQKDKQTWMHIKKRYDELRSTGESVSEGKAITEEEFDEAAGKKDACYHKVKARYKVWPSAYASGALVQCRKKGAANWGNKSD